jgi:hypothetical protein
MHARAGDGRRMEMGGGGGRGSGVRVLPESPEFICSMQVMLAMEDLVCRTN